MIWQNTNHNSIVSLSTLNLHKFSFIFVAQFFIFANVGDLLYLIFFCQESCFRVLTY